MPGVSDVSIVPSQWDDLVEPLAIIGLSCKFPGDADTTGGFWKILQEKRCLMSEWPENRVRMDAFYPRSEDEQPKVYAHGAHFLKEDLSLFDAPFFGISATEAMAMDPQDRILLETTYHALENAGIPIESVKGSRTGVYSGSMTDDYKHLITKDVDDIPKYAATGVAVNMIANRISWFYDFLGPSISMDSACSSSLMALDVACQALRHQDADMAVVAGTSMSLAVESVLSLMNMGFLSPDGKCHSFDHRANGYSRGEGFSVVLVKRLCDAIRDGNTIRAVIRSTGSNQDGHTPGVAQPSGKSQACLIRDTYSKAGLSLDETRFFEAHGTGTAIGDPIEAEAIGSSFRGVRSATDPLYIGACKSNIGHLEGGSGLAGIIKTVLVLENALIPPNANFEHINPAIDADFWNIKFPLECTVWPTNGLRRASVASFGFGGSNAHAILDDAYNFLKLRRLSGKHRTKATPLIINGLPSPKHTSDNPRSDQMVLVNKPAARKQEKKQQLLVLSSGDEDGISRMSLAYRDHFQRLYDNDVDEDTVLDQVAYTLGRCRSILPWKSYAVINCIGDLTKLSTLLSKPLRYEQPSAVALVFTGQGAQYVGMGAALIDHPVFRKVICDFDHELARIGGLFSVFDLISAVGDHIDADIDDPLYSQPTTTALQLALFELLRYCKVQAATVVGHSSGEIAAAYAAGALDLASACKVSYFRGEVSSDEIKKQSSVGAMISVNQSEEQMQARIGSNLSYAGKLHIACVNSHKNLTVSGDQAAVDLLCLDLESQGIFARKLNTGIAYHSPRVESASFRYGLLLGNLSQAADGSERPVMISSVTGKCIYDLTSVCTSDYWVSNMVSKVTFSAALEVLLSSNTPNYTRKLGEMKLEQVGDIIEVGPHGALRRPVLDIIGAVKKAQPINYHCALNKEKSALETTLHLVGQLFSNGHAVDVNAMVLTDSTSTDGVELFDLPSYPFNHSRSYWYESALSRNGRLRTFPKHELCGAPLADWNPREARWRKFFDVAETPWIADHRVNGRIIYPATGMVVMAIEAAKQLIDPNRIISGYHLRNATFVNPITIQSSGRTEAQLYLRYEEDRSNKELSSYKFRIYTRCDEEWMLNCRGQLQIQLQSERDDFLSMDQMRDHQHYQHEFRRLKKTCSYRVPSKKMYAQFNKNGLNYGPSFEALEELSWDGEDSGIGQLRCFEWTKQQSNNPRQAHVAHPTTLDAAGQLMWVALTKGAEKTIVSGAAVTRIQSAWMSSSCLSSPESPYLQACCTGGLKGLRGTDSSLFALDPSGKPVLIISHMETTAVGGKDTGAEFDLQRQICFHMQWQPDCDMLDAPALRRYRQTEIVDLSAKIRFYRDLESVQCYLATIALEERTSWDHGKMAPHLKKYLAWLDKQLIESKMASVPYIANVDRIDSLERQNIDSLVSKIESTCTEGKLFVEIGRNLPGILAGSVDPLEVAFKTGLAEKHYREVCENMSCRPELQDYFRAVVHKHPGARVIEVGAGTGSITNYILDVLPSINQGWKYDYTDISATFFEKATERFASYRSNMEFAVLNVENDPAEQGFELESYDVVLAAWVLHATRNLATTLRNVRRLLKPGGKLVLVEITEPEIFRNGFVFGTLPGWWLSEESDRCWSPCISEGQWGQILKETGFSGVDVSLRDYDDGFCHEHSVMIATAATRDVPSAPSTSGDQIAVIFDPDCPLQGTVSYEIKELLRRKFDATVICLTTNELREHGLSVRTLIVVTELTRPLLRSLNADTFAALQQLILLSRRIIWVTGATNSASEQFADLNMSTGLARVLNTEHVALKFVVLALEDHHSEPRMWTNRIFEIYSRTIRSPDTCELEYVEQDGTLLINRVSKLPNLNREIQSRNQPTTSQQPWKGSLPIQLTIPDPGLLDSLRFEHDLLVDTQLGPDEIEIQVHAVGINFRDLLVALGKLPANTVGCECAGTVTRVGLACTAFAPGQTVCAVVMGCMRTFVRCNHQAAVHMPLDISFAEAASVPVTGATAYHALIRVANLQAGETVLIHSAAGGTGQLALQIAQSVGAEIYATVGTEKKKQLLHDRYGIPDDHIFASRGVDFARDITRATGGKGIDVVLNSLSGQMLVATWEIIAPYGRFVEIGKADIENNASLPMIHFAKNVSFSAIALDHMASHRPDLVGSALSAVMRMISDGTVKLAHPLDTYSVSDLEAAFRTMQGGKNIGKMVLMMGDEDKVNCHLHHVPKYSLDSEATYLIAGGLGGLGRSAARWMARRGAKNLILLSRSGPRTAAAQSLLRELSGEQVRVATPRCDVARETDLAAALKECTDMPPIKGCIQATMVLQDALFETMTWEQWSTSVTSKVNSTWNLHRLLPHDLTFFIMLSSVAGVAGSMGQSNYAAGNTYQDALAKHRLSVGQKAVSIDLGWMGDVGIVAENADLAKGKEEAADLAQVFEIEFLALLDYYCDPELALETSADAQPILGLVTVDQFRSKGIAPPAWLIERPMFKPLAISSVTGSNATPSGASGQQIQDQDLAAEFTRAMSAGNHATVVVESLVSKLARALTIAEEEIDRRRPLHVYGVDSLLAVELRNWFARVFKTDVAIFDITGQVTLEALASDAARKSELLGQK